jgi:hypothetical protein
MLIGFYSPARRAIDKQNPRLQAPRLAFTMDVDPMTNP